MSFRSTIVPLLLLAALAGCDRHNDAAPQATPSTATDAGAAAAPAVPAAGQVDRSHKGQPAAIDAFVDLAGKPVTLAASAGKPVLLNLWATWCGPCVKEMPTLDRAATGMTIVAVGADDVAKVRTFLAKEKLTKLHAFADPEAKLSTHYQAELPTSILYDSTGHEVWRIAGAMDWTAVPAKALLAEAS